MIFPTTALALLFLQLAASYARPQARTNCATPSDKTCQVMFNGCVAVGNSVLTAPWTNAACVASAICFDGGVDVMLAALTCAISGPAATPLTGSNVARLTSDSYASFVARGATSATTQNAIDFYYGTLTTLHTNVWPISSYVIGLWRGVQAWTAFCNKMVPEANFADFLQYNGIRGTCPYACVAPQDPSCNELYSACLLDANPSAPWNDPACVLAASCIEDGPPNFASAFSCATNGAAANYTQAYPRLTLDTFNIISPFVDIDQQEFIDAYYGELTCLDASSYPDASFVVAIFSAIAQWTGVADTGVIPYSNFADYLTYY